MTKIGFTGTGYAVCLAMASALVGCGGATSGESPDGSSTADGPQSSAPQAIIKNDDGREYLRVDLWDPADLALITQSVERSRVLSAEQARQNELQRQEAVRQRPRSGRRLVHDAVGALSVEVRGPAE